MMQPSRELREILIDQVVDGLDFEQKDALFSEMREWIAGTNLAKKKIDDLAMLSIVQLSDLFKLCGILVDDERSRNMTAEALQNLIKAYRDKYPAPKQQESQQKKGTPQTSEAWLREQSQGQTGEIRGSASSHKSPTVYGSLTIRGAANAVKHAFVLDRLVICGSVNAGKVYVSRTCQVEQRGSANDVQVVRLGWEELAARYKKLTT